MLVERHFPDFFARRFSVHPIYYVAARDRTSGCVDESILKVHLDPQSAQFEFDYLLRLSEHFSKSDNRCSVPFPLAVFPDLRALLMSRVGGERLDRIIWSRGMSWRKITDHVLKAISYSGCWLAEYHKMAAHEGPPHILRGQSLETTIRTRLAQSREHGLDLGVVEIIGKWLRGIESDLMDASSSCVGTCEFTPSHIFVGNEKTSVVDFECASCGWRGENLAVFIAYCDLRQTVFRSRPAFEMACRNLLRTYASLTGWSRKEALSMEALYVIRLLEEFLSPWAGSEQLSRRVYKRWKSRVAQQRLAERSQTGKWRPMREFAEG